MQRLLDTLGGLYELARLGVLTGFRFRGPYWRWRLQTAFGSSGPPGRMQAVRAALRYGRWMHRVRRAR